MTGRRPVDDETRTATKTAMKRVKTTMRARLWIGSYWVGTLAYLITPDHQSRVSCWARCLCRRSNARRPNDVHVKPRKKAERLVRKISPATTSNSLARMI